MVKHVTQKHGVDASGLLNPEFETGLPGKSLPTKPLDIENARQTLLAVDDVMTKYPFLDLRRVTARYYPSSGEELSAYAFANGVHYYDPNTGDLVWTGEGDYVSISYPMASHEDLRRISSASMKGYLDNRYRNKNKVYADRPAYWTMIHEMGHIMDFNGKTEARRKIDKALKDRWFADPDTKAAFQAAKDAGSPLTDTQKQQNYFAWIKDRLVSGYSYHSSDRDRGPYIVEAIAEAFADVEMRGANAEELSKLIHQIVVDEAKRVKGVQ